MRLKKLVICGLTACATCMLFTLNANAADIGNGVSIVINYDDAISWDMIDDNISDNICVSLTNEDNEVVNVVTENGEAEIASLPSGTYAVSVASNHEVVSPNMRIIGASDKITIDTYGEFHAEINDGCTIEVDLSANEHAETEPWQGYTSTARSKSYFAAEVQIASAATYTLRYMDEEGNVIDKATAEEGSVISALGYGKETDKKFLYWVVKPSEETEHTDESDSTEDVVKYNRGDDIIIDKDIDLIPVFEVEESEAEVPIEDIDTGSATDTEEVEEEIYDTEDAPVVSDTEDTSVTSDTEEVLDLNDFIVPSASHTNDAE